MFCYQTDGPITGAGEGSVSGGGREGGLKAGILRYLTGSPLGAGSCY